MNKISLLSIALALMPVVAFAEEPADKTAEAPIVAPEVATEPNTDSATAATDTTTDKADEGEKVEKKKVKKNKKKKTKRKVVAERAKLSEDLNNGSIGETTTPSKEKTDVKAENSNTESTANVDNSEPAPALETPEEAK
jgi:hypothetical protein